MASEHTTRVELLQGTLDLSALRALETMGPQHAYGLATRPAHVADDPFPLNQGTLYAGLVRLEQKGWIRGTWQRTEHNREAKYYAITKAGSRGLDARTGIDGRLLGLRDERRRRRRRHLSRPADNHLRHSKFVGLREDN